LANTRSAQKRNRQSIKRRARNLSVRNGVKSVVRKAREAIAGGDPAKAKEAVRVATRILDRASSKGVLHAGNAARRIARLAHALVAVKK
jgi:small subunit ribosomal protein S20